MNRDQAKKFLQLLGSTVPGLQARASWTVSSCPLGPWRHDGGKSGPDVFGVRTEPGDSFCNCFSCGWHGKQSDLVLEMKLLNKQQPHATFKFGEALTMISDAEENVDLEGLDAPDIEEMLFGKRQNSFHEFPQWWLDTFPKWHEAPFAAKYLAERDVPPSVADALDIRADTEQQRVCFPIRDFSGRLAGLHGRAIKEGVEPRYRMYLQAKRNNPIIWMGESWVDLEKPIVVVEGPFDLASVYRVYRNVVSPLFSNPSEAKLHRMSDAMEWVTFLDRGTGGDKGRERIEKVMKGSVVTHVMPQDGKKDPGGLTVKELVDKLSGIVQLNDFLVA